MNDRERRVRDEAHRIWIEEGRPEGAEQRHWAEAEKRVAVAEGDGSKPRKAGKSAAKAAAGPKTIAKSKAGATATKPQSETAKSKTSKPKDAKPKATKPKTLKIVEAVSGAPPRKAASAKSAAEPEVKPTKPAKAAKSVKQGKPGKAKA